MEDERGFQQLRLELAVTIDSGEPFVTRTYLLEGDGELIIAAYKYLREVATACALQNYPLLEAVAQDVADGNDAVKHQLILQAKE